MTDALTLALLYNPVLGSFAYEVRALDAAALQAGLFPNPVLGGEVEDFGGSEGLSGLDGAEITIAVSQLIQLGGDRRRRRDVAQLERELANWDYRSVRLEVLTAVAQNFYQVLASQRREALAAELFVLAQQVAKAVSERVEAGKVSPIERSRAEVEAASAEIEHRRAVREAEAARTLLSATWGSAVSSFGRARGDLGELIDPRPLQEIQARIEHNPELARWSTERMHREALVALEKAARVPDLEVGAGLKRLRELDANAWVAAVTIPLPLFDRNQGAIREARFRLEQADADRRSVEVGLRSALATSYELLLAAHAEALALRETVQPSAEQVFRSTEEGYREGKFDLLLVLDAQRTYFDVTTRSIEALARYHRLRTEIERLIGMPLSTVGPNGGSRP